MFMEIFNIFLLLFGLISFMLIPFMLLIFIGLYIYSYKKEFFKHLGMFLSLLIPNIGLLFVFLVCDPFILKTIQLLILIIINIVVIILIQCMKKKCIHRFYLIPFMITLIWIIVYLHI